jgi:hypothetical protein
MPEIILRDVVQVDRSNAPLQLAVSVFIIPEPDP